MVRCFRNFSLCRSRLLSRRRNDGTNKQLRDRAISGLQSEGSRSVRGCLQEVRPWYHNHLHNIMHAKGRTLRTAPPDANAPNSGSPRERVNADAAGLVSPPPSLAWLIEDAVVHCTMKTRSSLCDC
jgi:hypothetical protein